MRTTSVLLGSLFVLLTACGGSTTSATGSESTGQGGANAGTPGAGGSSASLGQGGGLAAGGSHAAGTSSGGTTASAQGLGGAGGSGIMTEGIGGAGAQTQGVGGASTEGPGGSSAAGTSSAGGAAQGGTGQGGTGQGAQGGTQSQPDWATCIKPGDCLLEDSDCCGFCGLAGVSNYDSVDYLKTAEQQMDVCGSGTNGCPPHCAPQVNPDIAAFCTNSVCQVVQIHADPISDCTTDQDCSLHKDACCNCGSILPGDLVAIRADQNGLYEAQVCGPNVNGCAADCSSTFPAGYVAACDAGTHHCAVKQVTSPPDVCPDVMPSEGTPCLLPSSQPCEYGSDPRVECRQSAVCSGGTWSISKGAVCPPATQPGQGNCPTTEALANGTSCPNPGDFCDFGSEISCECTLCPEGPCMTGPTGTWVCGGPTAGCPDVANSGQPCNVEGQNCMYGPGCTSEGFDRVCTGGVWVDQPIACGG